MRNQSFVAIVVLIVIVDQLSKWWFHHHLALYESIPLFPGVQFTLAYNEGAAFSFLAGQSGWQRWFFVGLAVAMMVIMWRLGRDYADQPVAKWAIACVIAGALGNAIDRVWLGKVIDFFDVYAFWMTKPAHFPIFNIADIAITIGAVLLLWQMLWLDSRRTSTANNADSVRKG